MLHTKQILLDIIKPTAKGSAFLFLDFQVNRVFTPPQAQDDTRFNLMTVNFNSFIRTGKIRING